MAFYAYFVLLAVLSQLLLFLAPEGSIRDCKCDSVGCQGGQSVQLLPEYPVLALYLVRVDFC
jgi:hypothetical protein